MGSEMCIRDRVKIRAAVVQIGTHKIDYDHWDWDQVQKNPLWCPDPTVVDDWEAYLDTVRKSGSSAGAVIECHASGIPAGFFSAPQIAPQGSLRH